MIIPMRRSPVSSSETEHDRRHLGAGPGAALEQVRALTPDVVVVEGSGDGMDAGLLAELAQLAFEKENLRIIRISLVDEHLHIYHQEQRRMVTTQDLVTAIAARV